VLGIRSGAISSWMNVWLMNYSFVLRNNDSTLPLYSPIWTLRTLQMRLQVNKTSSQWLGLRGTNSKIEIKEIQNKAIWFHENSTIQPQRPLMIVK
jgi:hypothetical protein